MHSVIQNNVQLFIPLQYFLLLVDFGCFDLKHVTNQQELGIAVVVGVGVVVGVLVGGRFLKCAPIGRTVAGPHCICCLTPPTMAHGQNDTVAILVFLVGQTH